MENIKELRFFYMTKNEYDEYISNPKDEYYNGYFFVVIQGSQIDLYLGKTLIASSANQPESLEQFIVKDTDASLKKLNTTEIETTTLKTDSLTSAKIQMDADDGKMLLSGLNSEFRCQGQSYLKTVNISKLLTAMEIECGNLTVDEKIITNQLEVKENLILPTNIGNDNTWSLDTTTGKMKLDELTVNTLNATNFKIDTNNKLKVNEIQIGNVLLQDDGTGNLKITSITSTNSES